MGWSKLSDGKLAESQGRDDKTARIFKSGGRCGNGVILGNYIGCQDIVAPMKRLCVLLAITVLAVIGPFVLLASRVAASSGGSWSIVPDDRSGDQFISALTCFTKSNCVATSGYNDDVFVSSDGGSSWTVDHSKRTLVQQSSVYCESNGDCFILSTLVNSAIKYDGVAIAESKDGGRKWSETYVSKVPVEKGQSPSYQLDSIACANSAQCIVSGNDGDSAFLLRTSNGGATWNKLAIPGRGFDSISCPSDTVCYGVTGVNNENVYRSTNGGKSWAEMGVAQDFLHRPGATPIKRYNLFTIECRTVTNCVAGGELAAVSSNANINPIYPLIWGTVNGSNWLFDGVVNTTAKSTPKYQAYIDFGSITCPKAGYCFAGTSYGWVVDITFQNGNMVVSGDVDSLTAPYTEMTNLDCPTVTFCVAAGQNPRTFVSQLGRLPIQP